MATERPARLSDARGSEDCRSRARCTWERTPICIGRERRRVPIGRRQRIGRQRRRTCVVTAATARVIAAIPPIEHAAFTLPAGGSVTIDGTLRVRAVVYGRPIRRTRRRAQYQERRCQPQQPGVREPGVGIDRQTLSPAVSLTVLVATTPAHDRSTSPSRCGGPAPSRRRPAGIVSSQPSAPVAQLDRASVFGTERREFESLRARRRAKRIGEPGEIRCSSGARLRLASSVTANLSAVLCCTLATDDGASRVEEIQCRLRCGVNSAGKVEFVVGHNDELRAPLRTIGNPRRLVFESVCVALQSQPQRTASVSSSLLGHIQR